MVTKSEDKRRVSTDIEYILMNVFIQVFTLKHIFFSVGFVSFSVAVTTSVKGPRKRTIIKHIASKVVTPGYDQEMLSSRY